MPTNHYVSRSQDRNMKTSTKEKIGAQRVRVICTFINWILFLGFFSMAGYFMANVLNQYQLKKTNLAQSLEPIWKIPTIVICVNDSVVWRYKEHITIAYQRQELQIGKPKFIQSANETVEVSQIQMRCFKLNSTMTTPLPQRFDRNIKIELKKTAMSNTVKIYFTSEENSYGVFKNQWWDGKVFQQNLEGQKWARISLQPYEYRYLDDQEKCSLETNLQRWQYLVKKANFSHCPKKCSLIQCMSNILPMCDWTTEDFEARKCAKEVLEDTWDEFKSEPGYKRPCLIIEYSGTKVAEKIRKENKPTQMDFSYEFSPPMMSIVYQEYLLFDMIGLIASVGGTLGMCIGFSFTGVADTILEFMSNRIINSF